MPAAGAGAGVPTWVYASASGLLAAGAVLVAGRPRLPARRARLLCDPPGPARLRAPWARAVIGLSAVLRRSPPGAVVGGLLRRRATARSRSARERALPAAVDLLTVAVAAGCSPYEAVVSVAPWMPGAVRPAFEAVVARVRMGDSLVGSIDDALARDPVLEPLARALEVTDRLGAPVGPALARLSATVRAEVRRRDESRARTVPVRLLFPLVFLVLPAFGLLTVVPALLVSFRAL